MAPGSLPPCPGSSITSGGSGLAPFGSGSAGRQRARLRGHRAVQCRRQQEGAEHRASRRETAQQQATRDGIRDSMTALLTCWVRFSSLFIDYGEFRARRYDLLAVGGGLLHGHAAPAMSPGSRHLLCLAAPPRRFPAARDPLVGLVGAGSASVGKDPHRRGSIAVRVAPAILDLWRAGVLCAAGHSATRTTRAPTFTRGSASPRGAPSERQELMNYATRHVSCSGLSPRFPGGVAVACSGRHPFPEPSGGPLPASLASRR